MIMAVSLEHENMGIWISYTPTKFNRVVLTWVPGEKRYLDRKAFTQRK
jgi:hypothetical protein